MTRVSFYVLNAPDADVHDFACRLLERIHSQSQMAYVNLPDAQVGQVFNERLWTFKQGSFVPHDLEHEDNTSPIVLGMGSQLPAQRDVLLNLDLGQPQPPYFFSSFERALEIVAGDANEKAAARQRYAFYRSRGYELETHQIGA